MSEESYFNKALSNFVFDFASGGAIRHLADLGCTVTEIVGRLDFPTPKSKVAEAVWKHYINTGKICTDEPRNSGVIEKISYVKEQGKYGRTSMRRVVEQIEAPTKSYIACDFGKQIYRDRELFLDKLSVLSDKEREYILDLPWPLETVYHEADERMLAIAEKLKL